MGHAIRHRFKKTLKTGRCDHCSEIMVTGTDLMPDTNIRTRFETRPSLIDRFKMQRVQVQVSSKLRVQSDSVVWIASGLCRVLHELHQGGLSGHAPHETSSPTLLCPGGPCASRRNQLHFLHPTFSGLVLQHIVMQFVHPFFASCHGHVNSSNSPTFHIQLPWQDYLHLHLSRSAVDPKDSGSAFTRSTSNQSKSHHRLGQKL